MTDILREVKTTMTNRIKNYSIVDVSSSRSRSGKKENSDQKERLNACSIKADILEEEYWIPQYNINFEANSMKPQENVVEYLCIFHKIKNLFYFIEKHVL